jgi:hypothetical protein
MDRLGGIYMPENFEITGTVDGLEQKRYRDGGGLIPGFWTVKLQTPEGQRSSSFNSVRRKNPRDPNSATEPHPDFELIQRAQATGQPIRVRGHLTRKGEGESARTFKNGTSAELVEAAAGATQANITPAAPPDRDMENAKWAVEAVLPSVDAANPMSENDLERVKQEAGKLLHATKEVADDASQGGPGSAELSELERRRERRGKREGIA